MKNKKNAFSKFLILGFAVIGVITCLSPYLIPEPYYSSITLFLYGEAYTSEGLTALKTMPVHENLHRVLGAVFSISGILQFNKSLREKSPSLHRKLGYLFIFSSTVTGATGLIIGVAIPFAGLTESFFIVIVGIYLLYATYNALLQAYKKNFNRHRNWMIRAFSFALGVISMRLFFLMINKTITIDNHLLFNITLVLGFTFNIVLAELWIAGSNHAIKKSKTTKTRELAS